MEKRFLYPVLKSLLFIFICISCAGIHDRTKGDYLAKGFVNPPDSIQTSVYWYWISDHISREGVIKDLHAMKEAGINRAFIGNIGLDDNESGVGKVRFYSEEWWEITHAALKTATELGIEIGIFNSPGWSQSGGPWVKPEQSMRYLASSSQHVKGGHKVDMVLPIPDSEYKEYFQDVITIAYPAFQKENILTLKDGNISQHDNGMIIDFTSDTLFTLRGLKIYMTSSPVDCLAYIQVKEGTDYETLVEFPVTRFNPQLNVGFDPYAPVVISVPETIAQEFRIVFKNITPGATPGNVILSSIPFVERYPEKTLAKMYQAPLPLWHEYQWREQPQVNDPSMIVQPSEIIDLSGNLIEDRLVWDAPEGEWTVMRAGMLPTGVTNAPARPEATGLETDKMNKNHIAQHFEAFLGEIYRRIPAEDRQCWKIVVEDSYETGGQNFTDGFLDEFKERYGYDPVPFIPVYAGVVVESQEISDRFLWDMRRMVADKVAYDYVAGLREVSHKYGLTTWLENYGHWGFPGEFLQYGGQSDEIAGEFWSEGALGDIENRAASSCAHIYGKTKVSAESFTAGGGGYHRYPAMMKQRGDRFFTEGINNTLLHLYISQPYEELEPGVNATFGNEFNRKNIWYPHLDLFISYLKRVNFMLQQGLNVADVAYFIGENTPKMTGVTDPELPKGYQFDYINAEVIERDLFVRDGMLALPHGTQYRLLVMPKQETVRPELLRKIKKILEEGAVILGSSPVRSPSYQNYPEADEEVRELASSLWSQIDPALKYARIGKGILIDGMNMEEALSLIDCVPDCKLDHKDPVLYGHRSVDGMEIYFVSNQDNKTTICTPEFRIQNMQPELWNPITGEIRVLNAFSKTPIGTAVPLQLDAYESVFIVFRNRPSSKVISADLKINFPDPQVLMKLEKWTVTFETGKRGPKIPLEMDQPVDLAHYDDFNVRHYSGKIWYQTTFKLPEKPEGNIFISLNDLSAMAKIKINGRYAGGVWTAPYRVNITDYIIEGNNSVEIEVTTTWVNRLIGDLKLPEKERKTWVAYQPWKASDSLHKSGLIGPVSIGRVIYHDQLGKE
ncbi:MAG: glycoside hydrolase family 2 [Bacteroidia bacterium 44-10]|nr:MAG: glycoside hydrolase family 2 [Bacteroidia bacterium 44-10]